MKPTSVTGIITFYSKVVAVLAPLGKACLLPRHPFGGGLGASVTRAATEQLSVEHNHDSAVVSSKVLPDANQRF